MKITRVGVAVTAVVLIVTGAPWALYGQLPYDGCTAFGGFPYPGWLGYYGSPYSLGQIPVPPYFAIHPPVHYSQSVPRTYGYSPYAYPGWIRTPDVVTAPTPAVIHNPYVDPDSKADRESSDTVAQRARQVFNPYAATAVRGQEARAQRVEPRAQRVETREERAEQRAAGSDLAAQYAGQ